jgi:hypothetical protein
MKETFDITPSPRVLRMLGQIEFKPWQCLAELVDNSIDAFLEGRRKAMILQPEITISLPRQSQLKADSGKIRVADNGMGMTPETLEHAVKAGYSGNDPVEKLGLFGMGFNIATARLGRRTEVWTITPDASEWTGLVIDFDELERLGRFQAPRLSRPRGVDEGHIHGTQIVISKLDIDRVRPLITGRGRSVTMQKLGRIYTRLISSINLEVKVDGEKITPRPHCVWDTSRRVETHLGPVAAIQPVNVELPPRPYCKTCWNWLNAGEKVCPVCGSGEAVAQRERVIRGWLGIQRFFDRWHYGIDLIRNGRLIEELDKSFFSWENPDTSDIELEYPIDTMHWGGRIVGEIEIDFVRISHQKDAFDKHDPQWQLVTKAIRGDSPIRPHVAKAGGYPVNVSPLAQLFAGYRTGRAAGLQYLVPGDTSGKGMNEECKRWADLFWAGNADYQTDEKWYEAVLVAEEAKRKPAPATSARAEEVAGEAPFEAEETETEEEATAAIATVSTAPIFDDDLSLSGTYELREMNGSPTLTIRARRLIEGQLANGQAVRFIVHGNEAVFEYNPAHEYFGSSLDTAVNSLVRELSYQLLSRSQENQDSWPITRIDGELRKRYFPDTLLDVDGLAREASAFLDELREFLLEELPSVAPIDPSILPERDRDTIRTRLLVEGQASEVKVNEVISTGQFPRYLGLDFLPKALATWPELVLDGHFLSVAYSTVAEGIQASALDQVLGPIRDVVWLCEQATMPGLNQQQWREQLARAASSLHLLQLWRG